MEDTKIPIPEQEDIAEETMAAEEEIALDPVVEELKTTKEQLLRLAAEFDNYKKRVARERMEAFQNTKAELFKAFLPVMDNFERATCGEPPAPPAAGQAPSAVDAASIVQEYRKGVEMIFAQFAGVFEAQGVSCFGAAGEPFDPALHNAVMHSENPALGENVIAEVFSKGWRAGEKIIREAMVAVAN